jgi:hypothetical protein
MRIAQPAARAVDQDCSVNGARCIRDRGRPCRPPERNSPLEGARLQNFARRYRDGNQYTAAEWPAPDAAFRVHVARGRLTALTAASEKFGLKLA